MSIVGAALIADISGSTSLYEGAGTQRAYREIQLCIERLRREATAAGGTFIHSKGDDILAYFASATAAVQAAKRMVENSADNALNVHAGIGWGKMLRTSDDLYGGPVNAAARLAALAKPFEVLVAGACFDQLDPGARAALSRVDVIRLKGLAETRAVHSFVTDAPMERTHLFGGRGGRAVNTARVTLRHQGADLRLDASEELRIGRAPENGLVVAAPWVSRTHATITLAEGLVEFRDHSTGGSYLTLADGEETVLRRSSVTLVGSGVISLGAPRHQAAGAIVAFAVERGAGSAPPPR